MKKYIRLLTAAMNGSLQRNHGREDKIDRKDMVDMVDELKQLSVALDERSVYIFIDFLSYWAYLVELLLF